MGRTLTVLVAAVLLAVPALAQGTAPTVAHRPVLSVSEAQALLGRSVVMPDGRDAGRIADFILAGPDGRIEYAVLGQGGIMGLGQRLVMVPVGGLQFDPTKRRVVLILSDAQVSEAPEFHYDGRNRTLNEPVSGSGTSR